MTLQITNIHKEFGNHIAVNDLSITLEKGQVLGLLGRNGAGKTTTIKILLGLLTPTSGSITWDGKPVTNDNLSIGYLPEERGLYSKTKVSDQLRYFGRLEGMSSSEVNTQIDYWLERLEITEHKNKKASELSKGNQQKIQLIATLLHNPQLIILDEPFSGLDPVNANMLGDVIQEEITKGKTVIFSSHRMEQVESFCENVCILNKGEVVLQGELKSIKQNYGFKNLILETHTSPIFEEHSIAYEIRNNQLYTKVESDIDALNILYKLKEENIELHHFQLLEPTLHEIFIERAR